MGLAGISALEADTVDAFSCVSRDKTRRLKYINGQIGMRRRAQTRCMKDTHGSCDLTQHSMG